MKEAEAAANLERLTLPASSPGMDVLLALARVFMPGFALPKLVETPPTGALGDSAEMRIHKAETRYQALVEQLPAVTFMVSFENRQSEIYVSPHIETMLGYTAKEWVEDPILWYQRLHPADRDRWNKEAARTVTFGQDFKADYRFLAKDGRTVWIHGEVTVARDKLGRPSFLQGIGYDITELKRAEEVLQRSREELDALVQARTRELEEINEELNQFAYVVSHDLKAPLRAISSLADWLSTDYADKIGDAGKEQFRLLRSRVKRMNALVEGILRYSRSARQHEERVFVDLDELVREVCELVSPPPGIEVNIQPGFPSVVCERTRTLQVFENLVSNAAKYMGKATGRIDIGWENTEPFWRFFVSDTGSGIEEKYFVKVFQIFQTLAARDSYESTGIGLAIVKKNVERAGGRIWVESKVGEGSRFSFTVPKIPLKNAPLSNE